MLIVRECPHVTTEAFKYLNEIPSLVLFGVRGCDISRYDENTADALGWTTKDEGGVLDGVQRDNDFACTWDAALTAMYKRSRNVGRSEDADAPILHFRLGNLATSLLFSCGMRPLVFFRKRGMPATRIELPIRDEVEVPCKKRKIRERVGRDIGETFVNEVLGVEIVKAESLRRVVGGEREGVQAACTVRD